MTAEIREASERDLPGLAELLGAREGLAGPYLGSRRTLLDFDPARIRVWVAVADDKVAAISCVELRRLQIGATTVDAGYWTELFVHPDCGDPHLKTHLARAMLSGLEQVGITQVYLALDRLELVHGYLHVGMRERARYVVRMKPLRPLSLASKQLGLPAIAARIAASLDLVAGLPLRVPGWRPSPPRGSSVITLSLVEDSQAVAELLTRSRAGTVTRAWDSESLCARYLSAPDRAATDEAAYTLLGLCQAGVIIGVAVYRVATRPSGVRVGVVMELAARDDDSQTLALLLRSVEQRVRARAADAVLLLDALGGGVARLARAAGYLDSGERLALLTTTSAAQDPSAWRFALGDHDSF